MTKEVSEILFFTTSSKEEIATFINIPRVGEGEMFSITSRCPIQNRYFLSISDYTEPPPVTYYKMQGLKIDGTHITWVSIGSPATHPIISVTEESIVDIWEVSS